MKNVLLSFIFTFILSQALSQHTSPVFRSNLSRIISVNVSNQKLQHVLDKISTQGNFTFSYSGSILQRDSIVSIAASNKTIRDVLDQLFRGEVDCRESGDYIILRPAFRKFSVVPENIYTRKNIYEIEGHVLDDRTGEKVSDASVYEKKLLRSTLTDDKGYFKLKFKTAQQGVIITVSKENFRDTSIQFLSDITVSARGYSSTDSDAGPSNRVERSAFGRFLTSSRQRIQSLNIPDFIANSPFQASLIPGISSHGMLSSQIVNKGSLNIWGGYTAGVDGIELGGIFNVNKKDVRKLQLAGVLNVVGGSVKGVQAAGLANLVLDSVDGVQAAGLANTVRKSVSGVQVAGLVNAGLDKLDGVQVAGIVNFAMKSVSGTQIAGIANINGGSLKGSQIAGIVNYSRNVQGLQIGLFNVADTSSGWSFGLLNLVRKGYHKVSIYTNEVLHTNIAIKTGNAKLYTILIGGTNVSSSEKLYSAGIGWGHDFIFSNRLSLAAELSTQFLYVGKPVNEHYLNKVQTLLQFRIMKGITAFAGPSYSVYQSKHFGIAEEGYKTVIAPKYSTALSDTAKGWIGWNVGLSFF